MVVKLMDATKSRKWQINLERGERDWVTSTAWWPACKSTCTSRSQVALPERWVSQRAQSQKRTQQMSNTTPRAMLQTGKAAAIFRHKDRWARSISRNTRPPLPVYHRWAGAGQQVQGERPSGGNAESAQFSSTWDSCAGEGPAKAPRAVPPSPCIVRNSDLQTWFGRVWTVLGQASPSWGHWRSAPNITSQARRNQTVVVYFLVL